MTQSFGAALLPVWLEGRTWKVVTLVHAMPRSWHDWQAIAASLAFEWPVEPIVVLPKLERLPWQPVQSSAAIGTWADTALVCFGRYVTGTGLAHEAWAVVQPANGARLVVPAVQVVWHATQLKSLTAGTLVSLVTVAVIPGCKVAGVARVGVPYSPAAEDKWQVLQAAVELCIWPVGLAAAEKAAVLPWHCAQSAVARLPIAWLASFTANGVLGLP